MPATDDLTLEQTIEIAAPPATVWALVSDVKRMSEWSPQVVRSVVRGRPVQEGTRFFNLNRRGLLVWPTSARVVDFDPHVRFAFRVSENWTVWSFTLEPTEVDGAAGTRVVHRREAPKGVSPVSVGLTTVAFGGVTGFTEELRQGMAQTLDRVKAEAEGRRAPA